MKLRLRERWASQTGGINAWLSVPSSILAEATSREDFDSITIDLQHGLVDYQAALGMLQALSLGSATAMVRVPWLEPGIIMKVLDAGALGVICPMVNSGEEAENFVRFTHYAPRGTRSFGPTRAAMVHGADYFASADESVVTLAMIETTQALERVEEIVATPDLSGIYIGPSDLSLSMGREPKLDHDDPEVLRAIEHILLAAHSAGVKAGIHCSAPAYAKNMLAKGFDLVTLGSDLRLYRSALAHALSECRA